jgi:two-component system, OmpR family, response regulator
LEDEMDRVLIVDDDPSVCDLIRAVLSDDGFVMREAPDLRRARDILKAEDISVCLVDLQLKGGSGLDLVKELSGSSQVGTIILSGRADVVDRVIGLEFGADDYMTKPFHARELSARVRRMSARIGQLRARGETRAAREPLQLGRWSIDPVRYTVTDATGARVSLSKPEVRALATLVENRGVVLSRDQIHAAVMGPVERHPTDRRVDVYVSNIRKKLGAGESGDLIRTVHRVGYIVD